MTFDVGVGPSQGSRFTEQGNNKEGGQISMPRAGFEPAI
jgi:hypothetical protein